MYQRERSVGAYFDRERQSAKLCRAHHMIHQAYSKKELTKAFGNLKSLNSNEIHLSAQGLLSRSKTGFKLENRTHAKEIGSIAFHTRVFALIRFDTELFHCVVSGTVS